MFLTLKRRRWLPMWIGFSYFCAVRLIRQQPRRRKKRKKMIMILIFRIFKVWSDCTKKKKLIQKNPKKFFFFEEKDFHPKLFFSKKIVGARKLNPKHFLKGIHLWKKPWSLYYKILRTNNDLATLFGCSGHSVVGDVVSWPRGSRFDAFYLQSFSFRAASVITLREN